MAPEQFKGKPHTGSDQYALAVLLYELIAGNPPFLGIDMPTLTTHHLFSTPPRLTTKIPTVSFQLEAVLFRALAKEPADRFPTVRDFAEAFHNAINAPAEAPLPYHIEENDKEVEYAGMIICPYCLTLQEPQEPHLCNNPSCGRKLPPKYVEYARKGNITSLGAFGLPQHGKTALLSSLMEAAQGIPKIVPGGYVSPLGDETQKTFNEWRVRFNSGTVSMPSTVPNERPLPLLVQNNKFLTTRSSILVVYDLAGKALVNAGSNPEMVRALSKVNTIWCVVSLDDLINKNEEGYDLPGLFNTYMEAMTSLHISIKRKNILVVYTKADLLLGIYEGFEPLPDEVIDYLGNDPYNQIRTKHGSELPPFDEDAYFARMCEISDILQEYTIEFVPGGGALINMVREEGAKVLFTINSAFGGAMNAGNARMGFAVRGYRVLDALVWAMKLNSLLLTEQEVALNAPQL